MRYVVLGSGAIGGAIGGRLFEHGHDVTLVARGANLAALCDRGLELRDPDRTIRLAVPAVASVGEAAPEDGDVVLLATKSQDSELALRELASITPASVPVVCAQNGVESERLALRRFENVQAMCVILPSSHLEAGVVELPLAPVTGCLDLGRYPKGADDVTEKVASDLSASSFASRADERIMARKYFKLLANLGNSLEAATGLRGSDPAGRELLERARAEALDCYRAAGVEVVDPSEDAERRKTLSEPRPVGGELRAGGSSWQSLRRATGDIEADWLNGEIVLLGRLHGVKTPVNALLQRTANRLARERLGPGTLEAGELLAQL
jgi:2-dehydropantoate 2-reductase